MNWGMWVDIHKEYLNHLPFDDVILLIPEPFDELQERLKDLNTRSYSIQYKFKRKEIKQT